MKLNVNKTILLCIATKKGLEVLIGLQKAFPSLCFHVCTFKEKSVSESFKNDIKDTARRYNYSIHEWKNIKEYGKEWVRENNIYAILCVGWAYIIPKTIIDAVHSRVVIVHDSLLPKYRGFAPLPSALINGEKETGVTVILAAVEMDVGNILYQRRIPIKEKDKISDLINRIVPFYVEGVSCAVQKILNNDLKGEKQDHSKATYSIWRNEDDLFINWDESSERIERTVRALGLPYLGAKTHWNGDTVVIRSSYVTNDLHFEIRQPGKIWKLTKKDEPIIICGKGMLVIKDAHINGKSIVPMKKVRIRFL